MKTLQKFFFIFLAILFITNITLAADTATITISTGDTIYFNKDKTTSIDLNVSIGDSGVMGLQFALSWDATDFTLDTESITVPTGSSSFLWKNLEQTTDTYFFNIDIDSISAGTVTISAVRMIENASNKGLNNGLYMLLSDLKWNKVTADTHVNDTQIWASNFIFRDSNNDTVIYENFKIPFNLFLRLVSPYGDVNLSGEVNTDDLSLMLQSFLKLEGQEGYNMYADVNESGEVNTDDLSILLQFFLQLVE